MPPRKAAQMDAEELAAKVDALKPAWAQEYIRQLEKITRTLAGQLREARAATTGVTEIADHARAELRQRDSEETVPSVWTPAGITPPDGEYATVRLVDGAANMTPVADLPDKAEIRFADFYQVHYGDHPDTGGMRVLVIEGDDAIIIHPIGQNTVLVSPGGYTRH